MSSGEDAIEKAIEVSKKAGWIYVWVTGVRKKDDKWIVSMEALLRRGVVILDLEDMLVEFKQEKLLQ